MDGVKRYSGELYVLREGANRMFERVGLLDKTPLEVKGAFAKIAIGKKTFAPRNAANVYGRLLSKCMRVVHGSYSGAFRTGNVR